MKEIFQKITAPETKLSKFRFTQFLAKRYKDRLAKVIVEILAPNFSNYNMIEYKDYCKGINDIFSKSEFDLKKDLAFKIFDLNGDGIISEGDLFVLMKYLAVGKGSLLNMT